MLLILISFNRMFLNFGNYASVLQAIVFHLLPSRYRIWWSLYVLSTPFGSLLPLCVH